MKLYLTKMLSTDEGSYQCLATRGDFHGHKEVTLKLYGNHSRCLMSLFIPRIFRGNFTPPPPHPPKKKNKSHQNWKKNKTKKKREKNKIIKKK